jgi:hypothetical protein
MATITLSSYRTAKKMIRHYNNISFLRTCKSLKLIPNGLRATNVFLNTTNSPLAEKMANKHSRQWLQLAIDIQYSRLHKINRCIFPLNYHQYQEITRFESSLNDIKERKLQQLTYRQYHGTARTTTESKPRGFKNLSSETFDSKLQNILDKGPSFVNAEPRELPKLCLYYRKPVYNSLQIDFKNKI